MCVCLWVYLCPQPNPDLYTNMLVIPIWTWKALYIYVCLCIYVCMHNKCIQILCLTTCRSKSSPYLSAHLVQFGAASLCSSSSSCAKSLYLKLISIWFGLIQADSLRIHLHSVCFTLVEADLEGFNPAFTGTTTSMIQRNSSVPNALTCGP